VHFLSGPTEWNSTDCDGNSESIITHVCELFFT